MGKERYSQIFCYSSTCIFFFFPLTHVEPNWKEIDLVFSECACGSGLFSMSCIFKFPAEFDPSRVNQNLPIYSKWNGYWVFDQGQSSGFIVSSIFWNLMSFNLWEQNRSFLLDRVSLIHKGSLLNEMELQGCFLFVLAQNVWVLYHLLVPGALQNRWFLQIWKINQSIWEFVGLYLLLVLQSLLSWDIFYKPS